MKYYIITYGCQMNKSDSARIAAQLENKGYQLAASLKEADLAVINVCSVRQSAIDRVYSRIRKIKSENKTAKVILTGCILEKDKEQFKTQVDEIWPIVDFDTKPAYQSSCLAFVPIMTGCNNFCTYCAVPYTRGREKSRPARAIIQEVKELVQQGYKEITLLGQNVNSYKAKIGVRQINFPQLLRLVTDIPGDFQIKFLTSHPKDMSDELIEVIAQSKKIAREIHLPVQSGDDKILQKMNRGYSVKTYKALVKKIRQKIPQVKISTDIIVGFPSETEKQFQNTVKLAKEIGFSQIYVAAYSPRVGTAAAKLKETLSPAEKKKRKMIILKILNQ